LYSNSQDDASLSAEGKESFFQLIQQNSECMKSQPKRKFDEPSENETCSEKRRCVPDKENVSLNPSRIPIKMEFQRTVDTSFTLEDISNSDSCSLFSTVSLKWRLATQHKFFDLSSAYFVQVDLPRDSKTNGIWLKLQFSKKDQSAHKDTYLLLELYEKNTSDSNSSPQKVEFCGGKCGKKRKEVIELQDKKICGDKGFFQMLVAINEQCAHRSNNGYGSPHTRFYFQLQLWERSGNELTPLTCYKSDEVKVVAPGKGKCKGQVAIKKVKSSCGAKVTVRDMMEMLLKMMKTFDDRLSKVEDKIQDLEQKQKVTSHAHAVPTDASVSVNACVQIQAEQEFEVVDLSEVLVTASRDICQQFTDNESSLDGFSQLTTFINTDAESFIQLFSQTLPEDGMPDLASI